MKACFVILFLVRLFLVLVSAQALGQRGQYDVLTPGWATADQQETLLKKAIEKDQLVVIIRSADQYKTDSRRECVNAWARIPAFKPAAKLRLPTSTSSNRVYKALKLQLTEPTGAPDLWIATADLKLLAYVPYPGNEDAQEAATPAIKRAAELFKFYQQSQKSLTFAAKQAQAGRIGIAWQSVQSIAQKDARLMAQLRPKLAASAKDAHDELGSLPDTPKPAYEDPGPGYFFNSLFAEKLTEYEAIAEDRVTQALTALDDGNPVEARKLVAPLLLRAMQIPQIQEARRVLQIASEADKTG